MARRLRLLVYLLRDPLFARYTQASQPGGLSGNCWMACDCMARWAWYPLQHGCRPCLFACCHRAAATMGSPMQPAAHLAALQAALERWVGGTARIPLLGWLSGRAAEILIGVQRYYTYVERMAS